MIAHITVALDAEEMRLVDEYFRTYVTRAVDEGSSSRLYSMSVYRLWLRAEQGEALTRHEWSQLFYWTVELEEHAREHLWGDRKLGFDLAVDVRRLCFECVRLCVRLQRASKGDVLISPGV